MTDSVAAFRAGATRSDRMFWLDGGGARPWSGTRSIVGVLDDDDVSLTYDAAAGQVLRHRGGAAEAVGDTSSPYWRRRSHATRVTHRFRGSATSATRRDRISRRGPALCPTQCPTRCGCASGIR